MMILQWEQPCWKAIVLFLGAIQVVLILWGMYKEYRGLRRLLYLINQSPGDLVPQTRVRYLEEFLAWALKLPVYLSFAFLAQKMAAWQLPVRITRVLLDWADVGPALVAILSLQMGLLPAGHVYTYLVFSRVGVEDPRFLLYGFLPSLVSSTLHTFVRRQNLATDAAKITIALFGRNHI